MTSAIARKHAQGERNNNKVTLVIAALPPGTDREFLNNLIGALASNVSPTLWDTVVDDAAKAVHQRVNARQLAIQNAVLNTMHQLRPMPGERMNYTHAYHAARERYRALAMSEDEVKDALEALVGRDQLDVVDQGFARMYGLKEVR